LWVVMVVKKTIEGSASMGKRACCCKVESVVSVDERGQMVLPKEIRDKAEIHAGDKLAIISWQDKGKICCISLMKADDLAEEVNDMLGPLMSSMVTRR
jgi:antitoxin PrlF